MARVSYIATSTQLEEATSKYHINGAWIAVFLNPIFALTDYFNIPEGWLNVLAIRLSISVITLAVLFSRKKYKLPSFVVVLVPFLLISLQNAYTFSLITDKQVLAHNLNYMVLLIAGGLFILWRMLFSLGVISLSAAVTAFFIFTNPHLNKSYFFTNGGLMLMVSGLFMVVLIKSRYDLTLKAIKARLALEESNEALKKQQAIVVEKNQKITDSIRYAQRIQKSILGDTSRIDNWFGGSFVFFKPKDILSGDFYWFYENADTRIIIAADCTGHGVPAALMTVMGNSILNEIVSQRHIYEPDKILYELDSRITESFKNEGSDTEKINDGMDVSVISFTENSVFFAAAKNPLCILRNGEQVVIPGSKFPIGSTQYKKEKVFEKHALPLHKGDKFYIYSDGFQDQFGGETGQKYLSKRFKAFLQNTSTLPMPAQKERLETEFNTWKGENNRQTDDILIIGIEV